MNERIKDTARTVGAETDETSDPPCFAFSPRSEYVNTNRGRIRGSRVIGSLGESVFDEEVGENK